MRMSHHLACLGMLLVLGVGCVDDNFLDDPGTPVDPNKTDKDGDRVYKEDGDCDDNDPLIYPKAEERLNCLDDNCNNLVDEGVPYDDGYNKTNEDKDKDGYCPSTGDIKDCEGNKKRNPGMAEDGGDGSQKPNGIDDNCNGVSDEGLPTSDLDKDGFTVADGDCNDNDKNVNPGAIEVEGVVCSQNTDCASGKCYGGYCRCADKDNCSSSATCTKDADCKFAGETCKTGKCTSTFLCLKPQATLEYQQLNVCRDSTDNDCDKQIDELPTLCDDPTTLNKADPWDYARSMELCDSDHKCGLENKCPGSMKCVKGKCSRVLNATFNSDADARARAILSKFAQNGPFTPKVGKSFAVLSSGLADYDPLKVCPQSGTAFTNTHKDPDTTASDKQTMDYIELALDILVPTNAQSFSFDFHFFSAEYPEYVGTQYNDTFWVEQTSKKFNGNISFDKNNVPIRINNAFFSICDPYPSKPATQKMCTKASSILTGTGYALDCTPKPYMATGGSTDWLQTTSPVEPGETVRLVFSIFDKGDHILDSSVLIDNFRWKLAPAAKPITGPE